MGGVSTQPAEPVGTPDGGQVQELDALAQSSPWTVIEPARGFLRVPDLAELWAYREVVVALAIRQLRVRYKQSALGLLPICGSRLNVERHLV